MKSVAERLPAQIARLEAKHGPDDHLVIQLKRQLEGIQYNQKHGNKSLQETYLTGAR